MRSFVSWFSLALIALFGAASASASIIEYRLDSNASGTLDGMAFAGDLTITTLGDTGTQQPCMDMGSVIADCFLTINDSLTLRSSAFGSVSATATSFSFVNNGSNLFGLIVVDPMTATGLNTFAIANFGAPSNVFSTYDGVSDLGPILTNLALTNFFASGIDTTAGRLIFDEVSLGNPTSAVFTATLAQADVPEPQTLGLLTLCLGVLGAGRRRRRAAS